jgi:hypothetical protein
VSDFVEINLEEVMGDLLIDLQPIRSKKERIKI